MVSRERVIGIDLDLTLIDTRRATGFALESVNSRLGVEIDVEAVLGRLGPPLRDELAQWVPRDRVEEAVQQFRAVLVAEGVALMEPMPGAQDLLAYMDRIGAAAVVVTSRRVEIATACLNACRLEVSRVIGSVTGAEKAPPLRQENASAYIGDHPLDMEAARTADVVAIGVTTGNHAALELQTGGADRVFGTLWEVQRWLDSAEFRDQL
ncbi:HAD family hydrolase [Brachybacterium phenoliresistens]|uniref:Haloacid dehalogenase n=1 Tax=Brachybacterium phenoliresistens TaxID=396014 RepID=Z9JSU7_9MICO|nr:HAD hydrolase-like protein [Brachybacterium phenoliresistens]EWS81068.1 haloacid dehalogenase [Brachybacterium phenoliresistens]